MFQKIMDVLVDEIILGKNARNMPSAISQSNPLIYPRENKGLEEYSECLARDIEKKTSIRTGIPQKLSEIVSLCSGRAKSSPFLVSVIAFSALGFVFMRPLFFMAAFVLAGALSRGFTKHLPFLTGFDFCLFFGILASIAYGPAAGLLVGMMSSLAGSYLRETSRAEYYLTPIYGFVPVFVIMSLGVIPATSVVLLSMVCVAAYVIARLVMIQVVYGACIVNQLTYISTTILFNYLLFSNFGEAILSMM